MCSSDLINKEVATIYGLDGRKMSKSYNNTIPLFCDEAKLKKLISSIKTDSSLPTEPKSTDCAIFNLYKQFATATEVQNMADRFAVGISWADAKAELFSVINREIAPMREKYNYYKNNYDIVEKLLADGNNRAQKIARETLKRARQSIGLDSNAII